MIPGITKALLGDGVVFVGGLLPGDHQGPHRRGPRGQARSAGRPQGERHHRQADPGGHRAAALSIEIGTVEPPQRPDDQLDDDALAAELGLTAELEQPQGADAEGFGSRSPTSSEVLASEIDTTLCDEGGNGAGEPEGEPAEVEDEE